MRFDRRGNGLSDWETDDFSIEADVADMEAVAAAAGLDRFYILAKNFGTTPAIANAARHPDRVMGIICCTAFVTGHVASGDTERKQTFKMGKSVAGFVSESSDPTFLRYVATRIFPEGPLDIWTEVEDYYRLTTNSRNFVRQYEDQHRIDLRKDAATLSLPMLILHARGCRLTPFSEAKTLATLVPGARLISLKGENAWPLLGTSEFEICLQEIATFLSVQNNGGQSAS